MLVSGAYAARMRTLLPVDVVKRRPPRIPPAVIGAIMGG